jgi:hypothetical protein
MSFQELVAMLMGAGGGVSALVFSIWWLDRDRQVILKKLDEERDARIVNVEDQNKICIEDRSLLHKRLDELQKEFRSLEKDFRERLVTILQK